jgi:tRNA pseudouridine55 synthase
VRGRDVRGVLLLDKPRGITSNHALQRVKRLYDAAKAGHTGSLDPLATGMLPICFGAATRLGGFLLDARKSYRVTASLGVATDTADADGVVTERRDGPIPHESAVREALAGFVGEIDQVPPMYSALKRDGVPLYRLARRGVTVERAARRVTIDALTCERYAWPELELAVRCSKGTYVRTLVVDVAAALGTLGHVLALRRTAVEPFAAEQMTSLDALDDLAAADDRAALDRLLLPPDSALPDWPSVVLEPGAAERLEHGQAVAADPAWALGQTKVYRAPRDSSARDLLALAEVTADGRLVPQRVFPR